jgi:cytochrome b
MTNDVADGIPVKVWDWPVRVVHWVMVVLVVILIATGLIGNEALVWHMRAGGTLLALVVFRIVWGFIGSGNARFTSFVRGPGAVLAYLRSIVRPPHEIHATHNPIGGWMVIALLLAMLFQAGAGLFTNDDILNDGPLVKLISKDLSDSISSWHRRGWWVVAGLAGAHILAVLSYYFVLKDNLVYPMLSGEKILPSRVADPAAGVASTGKALVALALCGALVWWMFNRL